MVGGEGDAPAVLSDAVIVAVPALNEATHIGACLASLLSDRPFMDSVRIVVADGGSHDGTQGIVAGLSRTHPNLRLIDNPGRLQSAGINAVVDACTTQEHRFLIRCDAHARYAPGYVRQVATALASRPEAASVASAMDAVGEGCVQRAAAWIVDTPLGSGGSAHRGGRRSGWVDHAHHAGFRLAWFRKIGGYDPTFSHNEDAEYDHRLGLAGGKVWFDADIRMDYAMRDSLRALWLQYWRYGRGRCRTVRKHKMRPRLRQMIPVINAVGVVAGLLLAPILPLALAWPAAYALLLLGVALAGARAIGRCGLMAGPALGAMHMAWGLGFLRQAMGAR